MLESITIVLVNLIWVGAFLLFYFNEIDKWRFK